MSPVRIVDLDAGANLHDLHRHNPDRYPFLLQSTAGTSGLGRFDILFAFPGDYLQLDAEDGLSGPLAGDADGFLEALDRCWGEVAIADSGCDWPFSGGWFVYLSYELAQEIEPGLALQVDTVLPVALAVRCPSALIRDRDTGRSVFLQEHDAGIDPALVVTDLAAAANSAGQAAPASWCPLVREQEPAVFLDAVRIAKRHIARGDIYQANLSRGWTAEADTPIDANRIYASLCAANPAPFAGLMRWGGKVLVSSSPERLLSIRDGIASTRPIAGTRPRSSDKRIDDRMSAELIAHPKERAEHIMLIDLERNDLGRVCEPGSVEVDEMMVIESYEHVHHIVSNIRGRLKPEVTPGQAIAAVFPGGTITGCPKVRCMQIINELEQGARGAYTGSFGYLNRDGSLDLNILIRTIVVDGKRVTLRAGSGIVADSDPDAELDETRAKAKGLLRSLSQ